MFDSTSVIKIESIRKGSDSLEMSNLPSRTLAAIWVKSLKQVPMDSLVSFFLQRVAFSKDLIKFLPGGVQIVRTKNQNIPDVSFLSTFHFCIESFQKA